MSFTSKKHTIVKRTIPFIIVLLFVTAIAKAEDGLRITPIDAAGGTVSCVQNGASCTLTATPAADYAFQQWLDGNTDNPRVIDVSAIDGEEDDITYRAVFVHQPSVQFPEGSVSVSVDDAAIPTYRLMTVYNANTPFSCWNTGSRINPLIYRESMGHVIPRFGGLMAQTWETAGGKVIYATGETTFELHAQANDGYLFQQWLDGNTDNPRIIDVTGITGLNEVTYQAVFVHQASVNRPEGTVAVTVNDPVVPSFNLQVTPNGSLNVFSCWSSGFTSNPLVYKEKDGNIIPRFSGVTLNTIEGVGGTMTYNIEGTTCTMTATPNEDYLFQSWLDGNTDNPRSINLTEISGGTERIYRAVFVHRPSVNREQGTVAVSITDEETVTFALEATPNSELNNFSCWSSGFTANPMAYQEQNGNIVPRFNGFSLTPIDAVGGTVNYSMSGSNCTMTAVPNTDYVFQSWLDGETTNPRTIDAKSVTGESEATYQAVFVHHPSVHFERGDVSVTIPNLGVPSYMLALSNNCSVNTFSCWSNGLTTSSIAYEEEDGNVTPRFLKVLPEEEPAAGGTIEYEEIDCGFRLTAVPTFGYAFSEWDDHSTSITRDVDLDSLAHYQASFVEVTYACKVGGSYYVTLAEAVSAAVMSGFPIDILTNTTEDVTISGEVTINGEGHSIGNLTILRGGNLTLWSALTINNLYLNATTGSSSQLHNEHHLTYSNAYIDIALEATQPNADPNKWYAVSVPFEVDVNTGIARASGSGTHINTTDYLVWEYDGQMRADTKKNGWIVMYTGIMYPGLFYMIGVDGTENTWRFTKKSGAALGGSENVALQKFESNMQNRGWNAVGNPLLHYVDASVPDVDYVQVYDNSSASGKYDTKYLNTSSFVMASPFFVQVENASVMTLSDASHGSLYAPQRRSASPSDKYFYEVTLSNGSKTDNMFITAREDASPTYQIGKDLIKIMGGNTDAYIWSNAYGYQLCAQDAPLENGTADYVISLYSPKADTYTLSASKDANSDLYLLYEGQVIWNLSAGEYTLDLSKGSSNQYGLRLQANRKIATDLEETEINQINKVISNGRLYIIQGSHVFDAQGKKVR